MSSCECEDKGLLISELKVAMQLILLPHLHLYFKTHIGYIRPLACGIILHLAKDTTFRIAMFVGCPPFWT